MRSTTGRLIFSLVSLALIAAGGSGCNKPGSLYDLRTEGEIQMQGGQYDKAAALFAEYLERDPGDFEVRYQYGQALLKSGKPDQAAEAMLTAYSQRPSRSDFADGLVDAMVAAGKKDELYRILRANANDRNTVEDWMRLGRAAMMMGDADTAQTALLTAARVDKGKTYEPQLALSQFYAMIGNREQALRRLKMAYYRSPNATKVLQQERALGVELKPGMGIVPDEIDPTR